MPGLTLTLSMTAGCRGGNSLCNISCFWNKNYFACYILHYIMHDIKFYITVKQKKHTLHADCALCCDEYVDK